MSDFKAKVFRDKYMGNMLSITHNGCQWTSVSIGTDEQAEIVIEALNEYMDTPDDKELTTKEGER